MTGIRVEIVRERCAGYANCLDAAPDVFDLDDSDVAIVALETYPASRREELERAARRCPANAIIVHPPAG